MTLQGHFFHLEEKGGHFLKIKRALLRVLQNLGSMCLQCPPVPTSLITPLRHNTFNQESPPPIKTRKLKMLMKQKPDRPQQIFRLDKGVTEMGI